MRQIREVHTFTPADLERLAKQTAELKIIGNFYTGAFHGQEVTWHKDGSVTVVTTHTPQ